MTSNGRNFDQADRPPHFPVLLSEVLRYLDVSEGDRVIDGTFGAGGYSRAILDAGASVLAIDRDPAAIATGRQLGKSNPRFHIVEGRFSALDDLAEAAGFSLVDGVVLDVGVSSMQLDEAERGFSFRLDGPLDMRMSGEGANAGDVVNKASVRELTVIIGVLGEERKAGRIARAIDRARQQEPIRATGQLADIVAQAVGGRGAARIHPATRTFQALRIFVNRELEELALGLHAAEQVLKEGGRLVVVAFHSLEDRIVKRFLQERSSVSAGSRHAPEARSAPPTFNLQTRRPVEPGDEEIAINPRARSARLRAAVRTDAPSRAIDPAAVGVPHLNNVPGPEAYA
ncbi:MAG TPA: 16S rRNA (cytosine(1402)-N(4))-methyltransferase RsmH [Afifellaceae bacterium]|nr:16S rRNA (cytosine(1402)-N(4))-methyltransferase RsmH [Afifellaceae bacterium]